MTETKTAAVERTSSTNSRPVPPGKQLVDVSTLEAKYGADKRSIYRWADVGLIPFGIKLGSLRRWSLDEIDAHIANGCPRVRPLKTNARAR